MATRHTTVDVEQARQLWAEHQQRHDVSDRVGQAVGIDPVGGRIWFGKSAKDIWSQIEAAGLHTPVHVLRVGHDSYVRKGGRR